MTLKSGKLFTKTWLRKSLVPTNINQNRLEGGEKKKSYIIPIRPHSQLEFDNPIPQVTPVAAVEQRAITEI